MCIQRSTSINLGKVTKIHSLYSADVHAMGKKASREIISVKIKYNNKNYAFKCFKERSVDILEKYLRYKRQ